VIAKVMQVLVFVGTDFLALRILVAQSQLAFSYGNVGPIMLETISYSSESSRLLGRLVHAGLSGTVIALSRMVFWRTTTLEEFSIRQNMFWDRGGNRKHRFIHDLAKAQIHRYAAKQIRVNIAQLPPVHEKINHTRSGPSGCDSSVDCRFHHNPTVVFTTLLH
jgi:hypothetical protein